MKKYLQLAVILSALIAYAAIVWEGYFHARAQADEACSVDCLMQRVDALNQKAVALEHVVEDLTAQVSRSIKSGQAITLHTQTGVESDVSLTLARAGTWVVSFPGIRIVPEAHCGRSISEYGRSALDFQCLTPPCLRARGAGPPEEPSHRSLLALQITYSGAVERCGNGSITGPIMIMR